MSRPSWLLASALGLSLLAAPAYSAKPQPPPPPPRIVGFMMFGPGFSAIASDGTIYGVTTSTALGGEVCQMTLVSGAARGNLFGGPPPSPVVSILSSGAGLTAALENGDVYVEIYDPTCPQMRYIGNIFTVSGAARVPDFPPLDSSPTIPTADDTPSAVRPGAVK